jgi:hypothetical protein
VRLGLHRASFCRVHLVARRGDRVIACLGEYTRLRGWDFSRAGDAKARSLPAIVEALIARESRTWVDINEVQADLNEAQEQAFVCEPEDDDLEVPPPLAGFDRAGVE